MAGTRRPFNFYRGILRPMLHTANKDVLIEWLQENNLLADSMICDNCTEPMCLQARNLRGDGKVW